jgi:hypothetical protein
MNPILRRARTAAALLLLIAPASRAQFVTSPYLSNEGLPTGQQVARDSLGNDARLTSIAGVVANIDPFGTSKVTLESGKADVWVYSFYSPAKRMVIPVGVVNLAVLGFQGGGQPESIDSVDESARRDTMLLDLTGQYASSDKVYNAIKNDTAFVRHQQEFPGFEPQFMGISNAPLDSIPTQIDPNQPFWTVVWSGNNDSSMICFLGSKTGDEYCMRVEVPASVPRGAEGAATASLAITPNPVTGHARISVTLPQGAHVAGSELYLFNERGDRVLDLTSSFAKNGYQYAEFDAGILPAGVYFCRAAGANWNGITSVVIQK